MSAKPKAVDEPYMARIGWLRAAVLGANDGVISVASLITGVAAAQSDKHTLLVTGVAALVSGALSMAAGEYVSVSSQADTEKAEIKRERQELDSSPAEEREELTLIYVARGVSRALAEEVAGELTAKNALEAHSRDELGLFAQNNARPIQAALTSAATFTSGAFLPIIVLMVAPRSLTIPAVSMSAIVVLALLGTVSAKTGGANVPYAVMRVVFWGALAMAVTTGIGHLFGVTV